MNPEEMPDKITATCEAIGWAVTTASQEDYEPMRLLGFNIYQRHFSSSRKPFKSFLLLIAVLMDIAWGQIVAYRRKKTQ